MIVADKPRQTVFVIESNHGVLALSTDDLRGALEAGQGVRRDLIENESKASERTGSVGSRLLTAKELSGRMKISPSWLLKRARENRIRHIRAGKYVRFDPIEIRRFFQRSPDRHANS